jgi:hypothetical protein
MPQRYHIDAIPLLTIGALLIHKTGQYHKITLKILWSVIILHTILFGLFPGFLGINRDFEAINPKLMEKIRNTLPEWK